MDRKWLGLVETSVLTLPSGELLRMSREYAEREWDLAVGKFVGGWAQELRERFEELKVEMSKESVACDCVNCSVFRCLGKYTVLDPGVW